MSGNKLSIIIPTLDEEENIYELVKRIDGTLREKNIIYEIIFIDDNSEDDTFLAVKRISAFYPISFFLKKGRKGKAQSILEGCHYARYDLVAFLDADLQYPPESLPEMMEKINEGCDIVVANRIKQETTFLRRVLSRGFNLFFSRMLYDLNCDVQAGMKVFKKKIIEEVKISPSPWTFDLEFLIKARYYGYKIENVHVNFINRRSGKSKIVFWKAIWEIGISAIILKFKKIPCLSIPSKYPDSMIGAGIACNGRRFITHTTLDDNASARRVLFGWQVVVIFLFLVDFFIWFFVDGMAIVIIFIAVLSAIYFFDTAFNLFLVLKSLNSSKEIESSSEEIAALKNSELPIYTIFCPLFREAHMIPGFLKAIRKIEWPKDKLDVMLLLEENDIKTIATAQAMALPEYVRIVTVPYSVPQTKPKACNYGLGFAQGEYAVIFDAEDIPDPLQLKKAFLGFKKVSESVGCLQAKLNYFNPNDNLLTRFFTAEYSLWFDMILPGLQSINTAIPLGGTSNHFRIRNLIDFEGWDSFNVTEDCDLGLRIFKKGYRTAIIDSVTYEEANNDLKNWLRQRSRWIKGYIQTYLVHMRHPLEFLRKNGIHALFFQLNIGGKTAFIFINPILWLATISYFALHGLVGDAIEELYPSVIFYMASISLVFGNFLCVYYYMIGCAKRGQWPVIKYVFLVPVYWLLMSAAAIIAAWQLIVKPHYWEKTNHGLSPVQKTAGDTIEELPVFENPVKKQKPSWARTAGVLIIQAMYWCRQRVSFALESLVNFVDMFFPEPINDLSDKIYKKRILIFNWRDMRHSFAGGAEAYIESMARHWAAAGSKITIFSGNDGLSPRRENSNGVEIIRRGGFYLVYVWAFFYYIFLFRGKYDIIIDCQNGIPFFTPLYAGEKIYCLIHHVHQEVFRKSLSKYLAMLAIFLEKNLMPFVYKNNTIITVSDSSKEQILNLGMGVNDIWVINPGIELKKLRMGVKSKIPVILYLGRLKAYKSIDILIRAFKIVASKNAKAILVIAGSGEEEGNLRKLVQSFGYLSDRIIFTGKVSEEEKIGLLQKAWILVNPSMMEGWSIATIEANSCGTPVVASNVPGLCDSVKNGITGYLVDYGNEELFAKRMIKLIGNKVLRKKMSIASRYWAEGFDWQQSSDNFFAVINYRSNNNYIGEKRVLDA